MTPVQFTFLFPDGTPIANETFQVTLRKAAFNLDEQGLVHPEVIEAQTDANGMCLLDLFPANVPYYLNMDVNANTGDSCIGGIRFRFMVPDSTEIMYIRDLIVTDPTWSMPWDEQALATIIDAKAASVAAATRAETAATDAEASKTAAATSATAAAGSATTASNAATTAVASRDAAAASAAAALVSQNAAKTSETNSKTSETNAKASETAAGASATNAAMDAASALASKNAAATSETNAEASETAAANSAAAALASQTSASGSATTATTKAAEASTSATAADASKTAAAGSATAASNSATAALTSQNAAATSETNAAASEANASTSEVNALASENAAASSESAAATSASNAATSETNAGNSATAAATSETNALASENKAEQWAQNPEDTEVEPGEYSALHWAAKAQESADNAAAIVGARLTSIAQAVMNVNDILIADSETTMATLSTGALGRTFLGLADAAAGRTTLGLGTAALLTASTSRMDTTDGRAFKTGDFGIGGYAISLTADNAADAIDLRTGFYDISPSTTWASRPISGDWTRIIHVAHNSPYGYATQFATGFTTNKVYSRILSSGTWSAWQRCLSYGDFGFGGTAGSPAVTAAQLELTTLDNGIYRLDLAAAYAGLPVGAYGVIVNQLNNTASSCQIAMNYSTGRLYSRGRTTDSFVVGMIQGDNGYAGTLGSVPNSNANEISVSGMWATTSATVGSPGYTGGIAAGQQGYLVHYQHSNPAYATQEWFLLGVPVRRFTRAKHNGTWYDWVEVLSTDNGVTLGTAQDISGQKTFTNSQMRHRSATPGLWMSPSTDSSLDDIWMVMSGNNLQWQRRANNFTSTLRSPTPMYLDLASNVVRFGYNPIPTADSSASLGLSGYRWSVVYSVTGTINTSDAREKTSVSELSANEIAASKALSKEIGTYKWLASIQEKGEDARLHVGMTVQRAIEIMEANDLDPMAYGFICYDSWDAVPENSCVERRGYIYTLNEETGEEQVVVENVIEEGNAFPNTGVYWKYTHDETVVLNEYVPAGDRYSFRYDELNLFIAAGLQANQEALEARIAALEGNA